MCPSTERSGGSGTRGAGAGKRASERAECKRRMVYTLNNSPHFVRGGRGWQSAWRADRAPQTDETPARPTRCDKGGGAGRSTRRARPPARTSATKAEGRRLRARSARSDRQSAVRGGRAHCTLCRTFSMGGGVGRVDGRAHGRTSKMIVARSGRRAWIAGGWGGHTEPKQLRECFEISSGTQRPNDTSESLSRPQ